MVLSILRHRCPAGLAASSVVCISRYQASKSSEHLSRFKHTPSCPVSVSVHVGTTCLPYKACIMMAHTVNRMHVAAVNDALDDLAVTYLMHLPTQEYASEAQLFYAFEQAWWHYCDQYQRHSQNLRGFKTLSQFVSAMVVRVPGLQHLKPRLSVRCQGGLQKSRVLAELAKKTAKCCC